MARLVIKTSAGYIIDFNEEHQVIQITQDKCSAKSFADVDEVEDFINEYADAGYGFNSSDYVLENI